MKSLLILFCIIGVSIAQLREGDGDRFTPSPDGTEAPPMTRCTTDSFSIAVTCHSDCLVRNTTTGCVTGCDMSCNQTMSTGDRVCPTLEQCTLGCVLERDSTTGCPVCECDEPDDGSDGGQLNSCSVNATVFAERANCNLRCVIRNRTDDCFMCNMTCNADTDTPEGRHECGIRDPSTGMERECSNDTICVLDGLLNRCVTRPSDGELCDSNDPRDLDDGDEDDSDDEFNEELDDDDRDFFTRIEGAEDRLRTFSLLASTEIEISCADGFRCSDETDLCTAISGPCIDRRATDAQLICDDEGNFEPLQCHRMDDGTHTCWCVHPRNGSMVPSTRTDGIKERDDAPDCEARVFRRCYYRQDGRNFTVRHGESFVKRDTCVRCRCNDGTSDGCVRDPFVDCRSLNPGDNPQDCTRGDIPIEHGTKRIVGKCNMCGCNNGRLTCTDIEECEDEGEEVDEEERRCERCQDAPQRLVCGRDGRTYRSRCFAMNCSRFRDIDILDGPCSSQPICSLYPCRIGFVCIPLGGRTCLRNEGCTADERRICVNRTALRCRVSNTSRDGFDVTGEDEVCGSDRRNYKSICHLIQQAPPNTRVAHSGRCDREECNSGRVCGTDGVTYSSTCHLHTQSANAQVDYRGMCVDTDEDRNVRDICRRVREVEDRCENTRETCVRRVMSRDGCCPVCGGITTLAIDRDALDEYSRATDSDANLDEFMARMTRDDVIPDEVRQRCSVEVTHVRNSTETNIEVKLMARDGNADADYCYTISKELADRINNAKEGTSDTTTTTTTLPVEASFAGAAVATPLIDGDGNSGAPGLMASCLAVLAAAIMAATL